MSMLASPGSDPLLDAWNDLPLEAWPPRTTIRPGHDYWVIYARISADPNNTMEGVRRQILLVLQRQIREKHGWTGDVVLRIDNDLAASKESVVRPAYLQVLREDVPGGQCRGVAVYALDRFYRRLIDLEDIIEVFNKAHIPVSSYSGGQVDLSTREGRTFARLIAVLARSEIEAIEERLRAWHAQAAIDGRPNGKPGFGYSAGMQIIEPEADIIRWIAEEILRGTALHRVARMLNEAGHLTADAGATRKRKGQEYQISGQWTGTNLKKFILRERLVGWRTHKGAVVNKNAWPAILDEVTHHRLKAVLNSEARTAKYSRGSDRVHLLTGLIVCGRCRAEGKTVLLTARNKFPSAAEKARGVEKYPVYICLETRGGCNGLSSKAGQVDDYVLSWARVEMARSQVHQPQRADEDVAQLEAAIADDEQMLLEYDEDRTAKRITREQYLQGTAKISERISAAKTRLAGLTHNPQHGRGVDVAHTLAHWDSRSVQERHEALSTLIKEVVLLPTGRGTLTFDPERVQVVPRQAIERAGVDA